MSTPIYDQLMMIQSPPFHPLEEERPTDHTKEDKNPVVLFFGAPSVQYSDQTSISGISSTSTTYSMNPTQAHDHPGGSSTATELQLIKDYDQQLIHEHHQAANGKYSPCSTDESSDHQQFLPASCSSSDSALLLNDNNYGGLIMKSNQDIEQEWRMPLKIRFMRKYSYDQMAAGSHDQESVLLRSDPNRNQEFHQPAAAAPAAFDANNSTSTITMNNNIRVCSDCSTTKTPLWRGGPRGPKSLCNACGIRQRKARRAMAAAAAAAATSTNNIVPENTSPVPPRKVQHIKEKKTNKGSFHDQTPAAAAAATGTNNIVPENTSPVPPRKMQHIKEKKTNKGSFHDQTTSVANKQEKKQSNKLMNSCSSGSSTASCSSSRKKKQKQQAKKLCFEDWVVSLSENHSDFHSAVFPQDEKEAAILLMALSCGLVYG